jgi:hypothetical protein
LAEVRVLHYCGYIELLRPADTNVPLPFRGYVSPTGIEPTPPKSCVWAFFEVKRDGRYLPTLVVISETRSGYRADIYSDAEKIFGHRQDEPVDYRPEGLEDRVREMEGYLDLAAGSRVLKEALGSLREGRRKTTFRDVISLPLPFSPIYLQRFVASYTLYGIEWTDRVPREVRKLMEKGRSRNVRHSPDWKPITVPADLVEK